MLESGLMTQKLNLFVIMVLATFSLGLFSGHSAHATKLKCFENYTLPKAKKIFVGVETIHETPSSKITVFVPYPFSNTQKILDLNSFNTEQTFPTQFFISDGSLLKAFISVDQSIGSNLNRCIEELVTHVKRVGPNKENQIRFLKSSIAKYLAPLGDDELQPWDPVKVPKIPNEFFEAGFYEPGHFPLKTELRQNIIPLEAFLFTQKGNCLPKSLVTSLVLSKLNIPHMVRTGSSNESGHVWIELADGRHLDPTWQLLEYPSYSDVPYGWFKIGITPMFRNQFSPFLAL
jgi:hypothetical protein